MWGSLRGAAAIVAALALLVTGVALTSIAGAPELTTPAVHAIVAAPAVAELETPDSIVPSAPGDVAGAPISAGYRISMPRLQIDLPIAEGDIQRDVGDQRTPESSAFHLPGTALPGQSGNTYLYAHARRGMFLALWGARLGDEVLISAPDGQVRVYVVREILPRVAPTDVSSTQPTTMERLTLQTSTGPSPSDPRFVVLAFPPGG